MFNKTTRTNKPHGVRGARKNPQSGAMLVMLGKGAYKTTQPIKCTAWQGASGAGEPFDAAQAKLNRELGFC